ncbi:MAG TPA: glutamine synthetase, partial [Chthonomonas sp.]
MTTPKEVIEFAREREVRVVDVRFTDLFGQQQHFSIPATAFTEEVFSEGLAFDGSSIRGFKTIDESDMLLLPDPNTAFIDPFFDVVT